VFGVLSHLFGPWGFLLQLAALIHFMRRRPEGYWVWIILIGGWLGAAAYFVMEVLPDFGLLRDAFQGVGRKSRIETLEAQIIDNPSAGNLEDLGELYWDQKQYAKAREAFDRAIAARSDSPHAFYRRALCALALGDSAGAIPDLERVVAGDGRFDFYRAAALLADAYARTGQQERAGILFEQVIPNSTTPETLYNYASFLKSAGRAAEAREWTQKLMQKKRSMPRNFERRERPWFRKAKQLQKELRAA
jgi:hypothetical protein